MLDLFIVQFSTSGVETNLFLPPLVAFGISFFTSMAGISGAFLLLPFQVSVLGFASPSASSTNFLYNVIGTPGGIYRYMKEGRLLWPVALIIVIGVIPGILLGYYLRVVYLPDPRAFKLVVGIVLLYVAARLLWDLRTGGRKAAKGRPSGDIFQVARVSVGPVRSGFEYGDTSFSFSTPGMLMLASVVGIIGGVYGIGGGAIIAPFCVTFFRLPVHAIAGAVLFGTFVSSVAGVTFYSLVPIGGAVAPPDWGLGVLFGLGGLAGMYSGAKMQKFVPEKWIKLVLGIIVLVVALKYVIQFVGA